MLYKYGKLVRDFLRRFHFIFGRRFNKTVIPLALVGFEDDYSQLIHIQRALVE